MAYTPPVTPAPPPPGAPQDTLSWVQSRMPAWSKINPNLAGNEQFIAHLIDSNGGLNDPTKGMNYWDSQYGTPSGVTAAPKQPKSLSSIMGGGADSPGVYSGVQMPSYLGTAAKDDPTQSSDMMKQIMAELQAEQEGGPSPTARQVHLKMLQEGS